jgi:hypothetical protein
MKSSKAETFPLTIKRGSASVKLYAGINRGKPIYTFTYIDAGGRKRSSFRDLEEGQA